MTIAAEEEIEPSLKDLLGGRHDLLPRQGRPPPLPVARRAARSARRAHPAQAVEHLRRPAALVPRAGRRHQRAVAEGRRARAREARALRLPHGRRLVAPRRGRARRLQPRARARELPRRPARAARPGRGVRQRHPARRLPRARPEARDPARAPPAAPPPRPAPRPPPDRRGQERDRLASPTCAPATPSCTRTTASRKFTGFETKTVGGVTRDYLELEYKDGDRVFVPSDQLHKISRYVGADAGEPPLSKLGGKQWEQQKMRARRAAEALAGELINLYAERKRRAGYAFPHRRRVAARLRARVPVHGDARPDGGDRADEGRHGGGAPDGPPDLRRRRLRQDRGRAARRVQGRRRRQAGHVPRADDGARPAALRLVLRAPARLPVPDRDGQPLPLRQGGRPGHEGVHRGQGRHPDRHPPPAVAATCGRRTSAC